MKKILFLDVHGVLALGQSGIDTELDGGDVFDADCMENLNELVNRTGCMIVISSSIRKDGDVDYLRAFFQRRGFEFPLNIVGKTIHAYEHITKGVHMSIPRGVEVQQWLDVNVHSDDGKNFKLKEYGVDYTYCIVDDCDDTLSSQLPHLVLTQSAKGFDERALKMAALILNQTAITVKKFKESLPFFDYQGGTM
jgi:hypothetical protein